MINSMTNTDPDFDSELTPKIRTDSVSGGEADTATSDTITTTNETDTTAAPVTRSNRKASGGGSTTDTQAAPLLEARNLEKHYTSQNGIIDRLLGTTRRVRAVDGVSFSIDRGETLGIVGESGCGKTTLGETIVRLHDLTAGELWFDGQNITEIGGSELRELRKRIQMIYQDPTSNLNPRMTIGSIITEPMKLLADTTQKERDDRAMELLEQVGLDASHADRYPHEFSGGQKQRVGIARALSVRPDFVVCDEPVSALDVSVQAQILALLDNLQDKYDLTYLFISHDLSVVRYICDSLGVMYLGQLMEIGGSEIIFENPQHPYTQSLLSAVPDPNPESTRDRILLEGAPPSPANPPSGCPFHTRCPKKVGEICETDPPAFYDVSEDGGDNDAGYNHASACVRHDDAVTNNADAIDTSDG
jgi:oligopeptide/dipeptide ABC transporter ATP-binding protein